MEALLAIVMLAIVLMIGFFITVISLLQGHKEIASQAIETLGRLAPKDVTTEEQP